MARTLWWLFLVALMGSIGWMGWSLSTEEAFTYGPIGSSLAAFIAFLIAETTADR